MNIHPTSLNPGLIEEGMALMELAGATGATMALERHRELPAAPTEKPERHHVVVIGGGQAGLSVGYHLARHGIPFVILDASERIGDSWRQRWDSLRLFTPARLDSLDGMRFPARGGHFPTKDEMADYLESYAARFRLPVRSGVRVDRLTRSGTRYRIAAGEKLYEADHVIVAMSGYQKPRVPAFAEALDPGIVQLHSSAYRNPTQLQDGNVLIVGSGNSGAEVAVELARHGRRVITAGPDTGQVPFRIDSPVGSVMGQVMLRLMFHRILTVRTPMGRRARANALHRAVPLIRTRQEDLAAAGVERAGRVNGVRDGKPVLRDGRVLDVENVIWSTGYGAGFSWIDLPIFDAVGDPMHDGGVVADEPGLYFVGLHFLFAFSSGMVHGVGRDAERIVKTLAARDRKHAAQDIAAAMVAA